MIHFDIQQRLALARIAAEAAEGVILKYYQRDDLTVDWKEDETPVTIADRQAEQALRKQIGISFPDDGILGEEFDEKPSENGFRWILDPIDGTKSFVHGVPLFGTLIGLEQEGKLVMGVCRFPALHEVVYASQGEGCWWQRGQSNPKRCQVSEISSLSEATFCTTTPRFGASNRQEAYATLLSKTKLARGWGDCYGHVMVATGRADIMVDPELSPWDAAALVPILQEAGGHFLDWSGKATIYTGDGFSVNAALKDEVLSLLRNKRDLA